MGNFSIQTYNQLPSIESADARFKEQLASAGITRDELFSQLAPLFEEKGHAGVYAVCLLHRHYTLKEGERMVANGPSTTPSTDTSPNIIAERWFSSGEDFEYRFAKNPKCFKPPPSHDFFAKFKEIISQNGVDILGVSYAPTDEELGPGCTILEDKGTGDREQITTITRGSTSDATHPFEAAWIIGRDQHRLYCRCTEKCKGCPP